MLQGVYIPPGTDPKLVAALEQFAESLIETVADLLRVEVAVGRLDTLAQHTEEAQRILCEALTAFITYGDWG